MTEHLRPIAFTRAGALRGAREAMPMALSSIAFGLVFGVAARQAGLTLAEATLMSALVFAGSSQFVAIGIWGAPVPVFAIVVATLIVNARHLLMGAALRPWYSRLSRGRAYGSLFFMTDTNWPLQLQAFIRGEREGALLLGSGVFMLSTWVASTVLGHAMGAVIGDPRTWGLDFTIVAFFAAVLVKLWRGPGDVMPWIVAAAVAVAVHAALPGFWHVVAGALAGSIAGAARDARR
ncbi:MAG: AzlC family ABC transporter permease [Alphaproteobacteria bacterium]|nr:AzlC family ABC transporter permease [Alphaproteobacteria bacterium]